MLSALFSAPSHCPEEVGLVHLLSLTSSSVPMQDCKDLFSRVEKVGGTLSRLFPNELWRQLQGGKSCYSLRLFSEAAEKQCEQGLPSLRRSAAFSAIFFPFSLLSLSILAKFRFLCSQFSAHSEKEIQKGRRESEKRKKGWGGDLRRVPHCF